MATPAPSQLDFEQILPHAYDDASASLRVLATLNPGGSSEIIISNVDDSIAIGTSTQLFTGTTVTGKFGLDVNVIAGTLTGTFSQTGLSTGLATTSQIITDVPAKVPATPLANRNGMTIRVIGANTVFFGGSSMTAANGYPKFTNDEISIDIKGNPAVEFYAVCAAGQTSEVRILEVA